MVYNNVIWYSLFLMVKMRGSFMDKKTKLRIFFLIAGSLSILGVLIIAYKVWQVNTWEVTQYADDSMNQGSFYTITNHDTLIVIDGGSASNESKVRAVIKENGGHVDYWYITHPHPDHIGAFNAIYASKESITIGTIYHCGLDYKEYDKRDQEWDEISCYNDFLKMSDKNDQFQVLSIGDQLQIEGLSIDVLNSYDEDLLEETTDICNNASLVLKIYTPENSIMICGDCYGEETTKRMQNRFGDLLQADYLQAAHHGNHSSPNAFFEQVNADVIFFDAPQSLIDSKEHDAGIRKKEFEKQGVKVLTFETAPNKIVLYP